MSNSETNQTKKRIILGIKPSKKGTEDITSKLKKIGDCLGNISVLLEKDHVEMAEKSMNLNESLIYIAMAELSHHFKKFFKEYEKYHDRIYKLSLKV